MVSRFVRFCLPAALLLALGACASTAPEAQVEPFETGMRMAEPPPGAPEGSCWARDASPAVLETVTEQIVVEPELVDASGAVLRPAVYRTETRQKIVTPRREIVFQTPCPADMTPEVVASLQRALAARSLYGGVVNGMMDTRTRAAVRRYQKPLGLDSAILSLASARSLGLVAVARGDGVAAGMAEG